MTLEDPEGHRNHLRIMELKQETQDIVMRATIPSKITLLMTWRYLATGDSFASQTYIVLIM